MKSTKKNGKTGGVPLKRRTCHHEASAHSVRSQNESSSFKIVVRIFKCKRSVMWEE